MVDSPPPASSPVDALLQLGEVEIPAPPDPSRWPDYLAKGLGADCAEALIALATDRKLSALPFNRPEAWGPLHARRVLGQLACGPACQPLLELLDHLFRRSTSEEMAAVYEEIGAVLALIGPPAVEPLGLFVQTASRAPQARLTASGALAMLGQWHAGQRQLCSNQLAAALAKAKWNNPAMNGFLIADLVDLKCPEAFSVIEAAYQGHYVDLAIVGSLEDARKQIHQKIPASPPAQA